MMMTVSAPDEVEPLDLAVEAGGTVETTIQLVDAAAGSEVDLRLSGLPSQWFSLVAQPEQARAMLVLHPPRLEHGGDPGIYRIGVEAGNAQAAPSVLRLRVLPPGAQTGRSDLLEFLPRHFRTDDFLGRFLLVFQSALESIERAIDSSELLFDPWVTPPEFVAWLASWVDLDVSSISDPATQRMLIERAVELYRWKGTRRGLRAEISLRLGTRSLIVENFDGMRLGQDAALGVNTHLGRRRDSAVVVTLASSRPVGVALLDRAQSLLQEIKPAGCSYVVRIAPENVASLMSTSDGVD